MIDLEFVERLIRALDESGLDSIEIDRGGTRLRLSKTPSATSVPEGASPTVATEGPPADSGASTPPEDSAAVLEDVVSPMVGTFFRSPAPDAPSYVEVGSRIKPGDTLCIIEAMKLMNELESEIAGTVAEVCVDDAEPVEYGQTLFRVDPA